MSVLKKFRKAAQGIGASEKKPRVAKIYKFGGYRQDESGNSYWLNADELNELSELNEKFEDDTKYYTEFRELRRKYGIKASSYASGSRYTPKGTSTYDGWSSGGWSDPTKQKGFLSEWWTGWKGSKTSAFGGTNAQEIKLAVMRRAIEVTLSVVDDTNKLRMKYSDDFDTPVSYTDMKNNLVVISAKPVLDGLPDGQALDIMNGFAMHEASHSKHTRLLLGQLENPEPPRPYAVAFLLGNLAEDYRIEGLTSDEFPGFAGYFVAGLDYMWDVGEKQSGTVHPTSGEPLGWPKQYGPDLTTKLNAAIAMVKWENKFRAKVSGPEWDAEFEWWTAWRTRYDTNVTSIREAVLEALAHLRVPTEEEKGKGEAVPDPRSESEESGLASKEMDAQEATEKEMEAAGKALADAIRDFLEKHGTPAFCSHRDHDASEKVSASANDNIGKLVDDDVEWVKPDKRDSISGSMPPVIVTKPKEDHNSKRYYDSSPDPLSSKYRAALVFRPDKEVHSTKLLKRGKVDPTQLHRWAVDDWRMFMEKGRKVDPSAYIYLLVDMSGSMGGEKLRAAQRMAKLFISALNSMDGVTPKVYGHTGDTNQTSCDIFRLWERGDPLSRNGLIMSLPHGNNYDGYAIEYVGKKLAEEARNGEQRLLIVLSDGYPAGHNYSGDEAENHVREVVNDLRNKYRIRTLQIAIDESMEPARQARMFDEHIPYRPGDSLDSVPKRLTKWLEKVL